MVPRTPLSVRAISFNVRYLQGRPFGGEEHWNVRLPLILKQLRFLTAQDSQTSTTFMCMQEVSQQQLEDVLDGLNGGKIPFRQLEPKSREEPDGSCRIEYDEEEEGKELLTPYEEAGEWSYIGVGREDGGKGGEYVPVLYKVSDWKCKSWKTSWVSDTPCKPSKGWDTACTRHITTGIFTHRHSGFECAITAVHLDHIGAVAQEKGAGFALRDMKAVASTGVPAIMAGDFNVRNTSGAYKVLDVDSGVADVRVEAMKLGGAATIAEDEPTYTSFGGEYDAELIDFIFVTRENTTERTTLKVKGYAVMPSQLKEGGALLSDHRAVVADLVLQDNA